MEEFISTGELTDDVAADFIWDVSTLRGWPDQPVFHGFEGFAEFMSAWREPYEEWSMAVEQILHCGDDRVVALLAQRGRLRGTEADVGLRYGVVFTIEHAQVRGAQAYMTGDEALEAVGLRA